MLVVKDSLFVEAVWNIIFKNAKNCLFSCYYNKSNLTKLRNPILFHLNFFTDDFLIIYSVLSTKVRIAINNGCNRYFDKEN